MLWVVTILHVYTKTTYAAVSEASEHSLLLICKQEVCLEGKSTVLLQKHSTAVSRARSKPVAIAVIVAAVHPYVLYARSTPVVRPYLLAI